MCEHQWEPLAVVHLYPQDTTTISSPKSIYCLCSRVFIRNTNDSINKNEYALNEYECQIEADFDVKTIESTLTTKHSIDTDNTVSCYCSASHTDNISTDEHDSLRGAPSVFRGLQSSDSGADLTEPILNSEPETWDQYWAKNGEQLIWSSWIKKYSNYINHDFFESENAMYSLDSDNILFENTKPEYLSKSLGTSPKAFSFETADVYRVFENDKGKHQILKRSLSGSDSYEKLTEGWNPLSPLSIDGTEPAHTSHQENELLLSVRCSSAHTMATTDSMTNVTKMTISSFEISPSSHSSSSETFSSIQSSVSSSSDSEYDLGTTMDADQYWQVLWKQHFEEQYREHYNYFMLNNEQLILIKPNNEELESEKNTSKGKYYDSEANNPISSSTPSKCNKKSKDTKLISVDTFEDESISLMKRKLKICEHIISEMVIDGSEDKVEEEVTAKADTSSNLENNQEMLQLQALGLPIAFGKRPSGKNGGDKPPEKPRPVSLKRSHENDSEEQPNPNQDRLSGAFSLMGYAWNTENLPVVGEVAFRKKHIRLQNRQLKMTQSKSKHIYFDDDGQPITNTIEKAKHFLNNENDSISTIGLLPSSSDDELDCNFSLKFKTASKQTPPSCDCNTPIHSTVAPMAEPFPEASGNAEHSAESISDLVARSRKYVTEKASPFDGKSDEESKIIKSSDENSSKREKRRRKKARKQMAQMPPVVADNVELKKYWVKRFQLFSKFDQGIQLDYESWFSVTPEQVGNHIANRCTCDIIIDAFCGAGGNTIQFALTCQRVIAIDIDPEKIKLAQHNAKIYGVLDKIEFIVADFFDIYPKLQADVVFLSPPWGGPAYLKTDVYDVEKILPKPFSELLKAAQKITKNIAAFLPRNTNSTQLIMLAGENGAVEIEQNFLDKKYIALTAYYGGLINE